MNRRRWLLLLLALLATAARADQGMQTSPPSGDIPVKAQTSAIPDDPSGTLEGGVRALAFSRDGAFVAAGCEDGAIWLLPVATVKWDLVGRQAASVAAVAFVSSGEGFTVVGARDDGTLTAGSQAIAVGAGPLTALAVLEDDEGGQRILVGSARGALAIVRLGAKPQVERTFEGMHDGAVVALAMLGPGRVATAGADGQVKLVDLSSGKSTHAQHVSDVEMASLSVSPDGKLVAAGSWKGELALLDAKTLAPVSAPMEPHHGAVSACALSGPWLYSASLADETLVASARDGDTFKVAHVSHPGAVPMALALSPDGKTLACGTAAGTVILYDVSSLEGGHHGS